MPIGVFKCCEFSQYLKNWNWVGRRNFLSESKESQDKLDIPVRGEADNSAILFYFSGCLAVTLTGIAPNFILWWYLLKYCVALPPSKTILVSLKTLGTRNSGVTNLTIKRKICKTVGKKWFHFIEICS